MVRFLWGSPALELWVSRRVVMGTTGVWKGFLKGGEWQEPATTKQDMCLGKIRIGMSVTASMCSWRMVQFSVSRNATSLRKPQANIENSIWNRHAKDLAKSWKRRAEV